MKSLHTEIGIGAKAEIVWEILADLDGWPAWNPVIKTSGKLAEGETIKVTLAAPGGEGLALEPEITFLEQGREFRWTVRKYFGLFSAEHGFRVVPEDTGRCRFEHFETFSGPLGTATFSKQEKMLKTGFEVMNRMLKREAEKRGREQD